jgi:uncharacterized protein (DUF433 family)
MELESYFDFLPDGEIRIKGHRVYLEDVVREYKRGMDLEALIERFDTLSVEEIQACINYYLANRSKVDEYIKTLEEETQARYQEYLKNPSEFRISLKKRVEALRKQREEANYKAGYHGIKP